jgi:hypothetical protein
MSLVRSTLCKGENYYANRPHHHHYRQFPELPRVPLFVERLKSTECACHARCIDPYGVVRDLSCTFAFARGRPQVDRDDSGERGFTPHLAVYRKGPSEPTNSRAALGRPPRIGSSVSRRDTLL